VKRKLLGYELIAKQRVNSQSRHVDARKRSAEETQAIKSLNYLTFIGAGDQDRTGDIQLGKLAFYR
jgi:hypothetical protein